MTADCYARDSQLSHTRDSQLSHELTVTHVTDSCQLTVTRVTVS